MGPQWLWTGPSWKLALNPSSRVLTSQRPTFLRKLVPRAFWKAGSGVGKWEGWHQLATSRTLVSSPGTYLPSSMCPALGARGGWERAPQRPEWSHSQAGEFGENWRSTASAGAPQNLWCVHIRANVCHVKACVSHMCILPWPASMWESSSISGA